MDEGKIIILNLSKGKVGEANANLLGSMLITKIYLAAMSRADIPERELQKLPNFYLYVDEFQSFANESFANILSEARKYRLNLTIAHQYIEQMSEEVRAAVFGNVGTMIAFRVGSFDAEVLEKEFAPQFTVEDLVNLGFAQIYLKLMIDGVSSTPFSARTLLPIASGEKDHTLEIIEASRNHFAQKRAFVEEAIISWQAEDSKNSSSGTKNDSKAKTSSGSYDKNAKKSDSTSSNSSAASNSSSYKKNNNVSSSEPYKGKTYEKTQPKQENKPFKDALKQEVTPEKLDQIKATENNSSVQSKTDLAQTLSHFIAKEKAPAPPKEKTDNSIDTKPQSIGASKSFNNSNTSIGSGADSLTTPPHRPKQPSKENVNQLKDALKDILKDAHKQDKKIDTKENSGQPKVLDDHDKQLKNLEQKVADIEQSRKTNSNSNSVNPNSPNPSKENNSITQKKTEATSPGVENSNNSKSSEGFGHKKSVVSNHTSTVHIQKTQASSHVPDEKKEVPEHVLRKVLDTNNAK